MGSVDVRWWGGVPYHRSVYWRRPRRPVLHHMSPRVQHDRVRELFLQREDWDAGGHVREKERKVTMKSIVFVESHERDRPLTTTLVT
jgi:hypothetical protein